MDAMRPGRNIFTNSFLRAEGIGLRMLRSLTSATEGGGIFSKKKTAISNGTENTKPVINGSQYSLVPKCCRINPATVFTNPEENMKLTESAAPIKSVALLPSTYEKIIPQI